jgi:hypothetical protein
MRRGPKGKSPDELRAAGETRPSRAVVSLYPDHASRPDPDAIPAPSGMTSAARKIWATKVDRYRQRGQKISGFEDGLRQLCEIEAALNKAWKNGTATMAMVNAHRLWCAEFFDTPASQKVPATGGGGAANRFARNGKP